LDELKKVGDNPYISVGTNDIDLNDFSGSVMSKNFERIYELLIICPKEYPNVPPCVIFITEDENTKKIMKNGEISCLKNIEWDLKKKHNITYYLMEIRKNMGIA
jgi:ubiquitin-protein ligase